MTTIGAVFLPQFPPERLRSVATTADQAGLDQLWLWEDCFKESGIASASAALAWTTDLRVGVGLLPVPLRNVALTAMEMATLHRLFPVRALLGVGHGVQEWMGQVGARVDSPVTLLAEHLSALRRLLGGERVSVAGRYVRLDGVALDWPPATPVPVLAGAEGPRTLRLSGSHADGTLLTSGTTPDVVRRAAELVQSGREEAARGGESPITVFLMTATGGGAQARMDAECSRWGWESSVDRSVVGTVDSVADSAARWAAAGADTIVLQPTSDEPDPEGFVEFAARVGQVLSG